MLMDKAKVVGLPNVLTGIWLSPNKRSFQMRYFSNRPAAIVMSTPRLLIASIMLFTTGSVLTPRAEAADLFTQNKLNASQQSKVARAIAQTRQLRSDGNMQSIENNARGQANTGNNTNARSNDRSCNNNAANVEVPKGHRGKIDNLTVVKGDVIMVCRTR
jgi:hypothetical protein